MEARHLQLSLQIELRDRALTHFEEIVVLREISEYPRMDEQRGLPILRVGGGQRLQLCAQILEQSGGTALLTDDEMHAIAPVGIFGEWAEIQADH